MCVVITVLIASTPHSKAQTIVRVLAYPFPPFLNEDMQTGLTIDLIALLNETQSKFVFDLNIRSPKRRYRGLSQGKHDMIFFEMPQWGWKDKGINFSTTKEIMRGGEVYIAAQKRGRGQAYFQNLKNKSISAHFGYHYGFAGFNSNRKWLQKNFKIGLHTSHERIIDLVAKEKVDIGVVTLSYLKQYLRSHPMAASKLLISERFDQIYSLPAMVSGESVISVKEFEALLNQLKKTGALQSLFKKNGLLKQLTY